MQHGLFCALKALKHETSLKRRPIMSTETRIYVACLAAYNAGYLHGEWIDVTDTDSINEQVQAMLKASPIPNDEANKHKKRNPRL
jgi:Antirestriction protein (ArdA)